MSDGVSSPGRASRRRWLLLASAALAAAVAVGVVWALGGSGTSSPGGYRVTAVPVAAGWKVDGASHAILSVSRASPLQQLMDAKADNHVAAPYDDPNRGPAVTFVGATGSFGDPSGLIARMRADPTVVTWLHTAHVTWTEVPPGPHGGRAFCGNVVIDPDPARRVPVCAWQTTTSFGELTQLPSLGMPSFTGAGRIDPAMTSQALAALMLRMRMDVERPS